MWQLQNTIKMYPYNSKEIVQKRSGSTTYSTGWFVLLKEADVTQGQHREIGERIDVVFSSKIVKLLCVKSLKVQRDYASGKVGNLQTQILVIQSKICHCSQDLI